MRVRYNHALDVSPHVYDVKGNHLRVGKGTDNDIVLHSPFVADRALELFQKPEGWELLVGGGVCQVGDKEMYLGDRMILDADVSLTVGPFTVQLEFPESARQNADEIRRDLDRRMSDLISEVHLELLQRMDLKTQVGDARNLQLEYLLILEKTIEEIARKQGLLAPENESLAVHVAGHALRNELLNQLLSASGNRPESVLTKTETWNRLVSVVPDRERESTAAVARIHKRLELDSVEQITARLDIVEREFWNVYATVAGSLHDDFIAYLAFRYFKQQIKDIVFGYGPLEDLLRTPTVSEIMVVDREHIYIERGGILENSGRRFTSDEVTEAVIQRIVARVGKRIDKSEPLVDARLIDGSRVNAVIPPLAVSGPCLTIRKFPLRRLKIDDLIAAGSLTKPTAAFLKAAVLARSNLLIAGGTGSGKTTLLNCLSEFIPDKERIVTIEDTAELQLSKEHVVRLETRKDNVEGRGGFSIQRLVVNSLRMRPDRIVVGECRGPEALDMLQAMNTGHDGSMTTIHANSAADVILRLEVLVQMAAPLPLESIHRQIASAVDLIVQTSRGRDGKRRVTQITEVVEYDEAAGQIRLKDLFLLETINGKPTLVPTGCLPTFMDHFIEIGVLDLDTFYL